MGTEAEVRRHNMPTVPTYERQVDPAALPGPRVSVDAPIEAFGGGQQQVTQSIMAGGREVLAIQAEADNAKVSQMNNEATRVKNSLLYNQKDGLVTQTGESAFAAPEIYSKRLKDEYDKIEASATNPTQRAMFRRMRESQETEFMGHIDRHSATERIKYEEEIHKSNVATITDDISKNWSVPGKVDDGLFKLSAEIHRNRDGKAAPEVIDQEIKSARSLAHLDVLKNMTAGGADQLAEEYYKKYKNEIVGKDDTSAKSIIEVSSTMGESLRLSRSIISKYGDDYASQNRALNKISDPKVYQATRQILNQINSDNERAEKQAYEHNFDKTYKQAVSGGMLSITPEQWTRLDAKDQNSIYKAVRQAQQGVPTETDWDEYTRLIDLKATDPQAFMAESPERWRPYLAEREYKEIVKLRGNESANDLKIKDDEVNGVLAEFGYYKPSKGADEEDWVEWNDRNRAARDELEYAASQKGSALTPDESRKVVGDMMAEYVTEKGILNDTEVPGFRLDISNIPNEEQVKIVNALRASGKPVNAANIVRVWRSLNRGRD